MKKKIGWEDAILEVLHQCKGVITLKELYAEVPKLIGKSQAKDFNHNIRGYLRRLKNKDKIKQIGLATYALKNFKATNNIYENLITKKINEKNFLSIPPKKLHNYIEGMLVEIGNMRGFETYTPDKSVIFNGKPLLDLISYQKVPLFTYEDRIKKISQIDVIWFKEDYPVKTFDVEHSTDFTKALVRSYQLKYFKTDCFMVAGENKERIFRDRVNTKPFDEIKGNIKMVSTISVFKDYQSILEYNKAKTKSPLL